MKELWDNGYDFCSGNHMTFYVRDEDDEDGNEEKRNNKFLN